MRMDAHASSSSLTPRSLQFWGKTDKDDQSRYHPLLFHMLDVAAVAGSVWDSCLTAQLRDRLGSSRANDARAQIMLLSGAHDLGKACPGFQRKASELSQQITCPFSENDQVRPHGFISACVLRETLGSASGCAVLGQIAGGHHGVFPQSADLRLGRDTLGNECWNTVRQDLLQQLDNAVGLNPDQAAKWSAEITDPGLVPILAGFISVVDWIGSNQDFFPCVASAGTPVCVSVAEYWSTAQEQARRALERLGWLPAVTFADEAQFGAVFSGFNPNVLQNATAELASKQTSPYLMIVEAPMGQGKTEAALHAADIAMCRGFARGMYIAMPTQATGNAMFRRVLDDYLKNRGHTGKLNLQLIHGDALLAQTAEVKEGEVSDFKPESIGDDGDLEAQSWFTKKKRPLLAPFGVGTIDQSLLSVLQTKHWFVRLFGLAGKVVIFDEVHAYDAYMSTILERLLHWLAEMECTVILVSATLPEAKRKALVKAYSGRDDAEYKRYPRITMAKPCRYPDTQADSRPTCTEIPAEDARTVGVRFAGTDLPGLAGTLSLQLEHGGCAAVICNTVDRSIEVYEHLRDNLGDTECLLFHARTLRMWRREREAEVLRKFGKGEKLSDGFYLNSNRPTRAVLVATQVIEQSLDLDFDVMVSEMAPIDLLLQRSGRLHRHQRKRPAGLETPQFIVLCDGKATGPPPETFGKSIEYVYDRYILLRTWLALRGCAELRLPAEIEALIERVYGEPDVTDGEGWPEALADAKDHMEFEEGESRKAACGLLVSKPADPSDLIEKFNDQLEDDEDPRVHKTVRAATREGDPSITVVMLPDGEALIANPGIPEVRRLLDLSAKLSHCGLFCALLAEGETPAEWAKNAHLRHARLLRLDQQSHGRVGGYVLTVDEGLGVEIKKEGGDSA